MDATTTTAEPQHKPASAVVEEAEESSSSSSRYQWWIQMIIYSVFVLGGAAVGTLLGRFYFKNGAKSVWLATLMQVVGFPILIPFRWLKTHRHNNQQHRPTQIQTRPKNYSIILPLIYVAIGIFNAADCLLYTIGLQYLPVTTYILLCTSQLAFNALFSYLLNGQKSPPTSSTPSSSSSLTTMMIRFQTRL